MQRSQVAGGASDALKRILGQAAAPARTSISDCQWPKNSAIDGAGWSQRMCQRRAYHPLNSRL